MAAKKAAAKKEAPQKTAAKKSEKKLGSESRFYVVKTAAQAREKIQDSLKDAKEKYVKKQFESGKEFMGDLKGHPIKTIDSLINDGKEVLKKARSQRIGEVKKTLDKARSGMKERLDEINTQKSQVVKGIESDAKLIVEDAVAMGKRNLDRIPFKKSLEEKISKGMASIPSKLNLPSRDEIDSLVSGIDGVNKKVDALNKQVLNA